MLNGAVVCAAILMLQVLMAGPAGCALAKLPFRGRPVLFGAVVALMIALQVPAIAAFATLSIIAHWNCLHWPLIVVTPYAMMTPPAGLDSFRASGDSTGETWAQVAGGVIITAPLVVGFVFAQAHLLRRLKMVVVKQVAHKSANDADKTDRRNGRAALCGIRPDRWDAN